MQFSVMLKASGISAEKHASDVPLGGRGNIYIGVNLLPALPRSYAILDIFTATAFWLIPQLPDQKGVGHWTMGNKASLVVGM